MRTWLPALLATLLAAAPAPVAGRTDPAEVRARTLFQEAMALVSAGRTDEAIEKLGAAYSLFPSPALLYNLGLAFEKKGDVARAVRFYRRYLREGGAADPGLDAHVRQLEGTLPAAGAPVAAREAESPVVRPRAGIAQAPQAAPAQAVAGRAGAAGRGPWPWVAVGATGAALVIGAVLAGVSRAHYLDARDLSRTANPTPAQEARLASLKSQVRRESIGADVTLALAAAAAGATLYLFLRPVARPAGAAPVVTPVAGPDGSAGVAWTGRF